MVFQMSRCLAAVFALVAVADKLDGAASPVIGQLRGTSSDGNETSARTVHVKNSALHSVVIASSCSQSQKLLSGGDLSLVISKAQQFWVVPEGSGWDCQAGCSNCFYLTANLTSDGELEGNIGYGNDNDTASNAIGAGEEDDDENDNNGGEEDEADNATDIPGANDDTIMVAGVELKPIGRFDGAKDSVSCAESLCDVGRQVAAGKNGLSFEIQGAAILEDLAVSFWRGSWRRQRRRVWRRHRRRVWRRHRRRFWRRRTRRSWRRHGWYR
jgi:hypothetical protein